LLLEDEADLAHPIVAALRSDRFDVAWARTLDEARAALVEQDVDLAILDVMLPGDEDCGFRFAGELRSVGYAGGILFLTARDSVSDRVEGLELGGDDYLVKPFSLRELLARVKALLRRPAQTRGGALERGRLMVDLNARRVTWDGGGAARSVLPGRQLRPPCRPRLRQPDPAGDRRHRHRDRTGRLPAGPMTRSCGSRSGALQHAAPRRVALARRHRHARSAATHARSGLACGSA
jgi:CheY-like chemotaxis protein